MKKVRYLAGAVGAAPVLGLMFPAAATADVAHAANPAGKVVSHGHRAAVKVAPATSTSTSASTVNAGSSCAGHTFKIVKNSAESTKFWYTPAKSGVAACIGTVEGRWVTPPLKGKHPAWDMRIRIYSGKSPNHKAYSKHIGASTTWSDQLTAAQGVHRWFGTVHGGPVQVCTAWISISGLYQDSVDAGPQCITVQ